MVVGRVDATMTVRMGTSRSRLISCLRVQDFCVATTMRFRHWQRDSDGVTSADVSYCRQQSSTLIRQMRTIGYVGLSLIASGDVNMDRQGRTYYLDSYVEEPQKPPYISMEDWVLMPYESRVTFAFAHREAVMWVLAEIFVEECD